jgi:hypothetical protein
VLGNIFWLGELKKLRERFFRQSTVTKKPAREAFFAQVPSIAARNQWLTRSIVQSQATSRGNLQFSQ